MSSNKREANASDLPLLIRTMSKPEKSYYKKIVNRFPHQKDALHLRLFKLIEDDILLDERRWREILGLENETHFSGLKTYLQKDILDTLIFQNRNSSLTIRLHFMQEKISLLLERQLYGAALKLCKKAILLAEQYSKYDSLVRLLYLQHAVLKYGDYKQYRIETDINFSFIQKMLQRQNILENNKLLYEMVKSLSHRTWLRVGIKELWEIKKLKNSLEEGRPDLDTCPLISLVYLNALALCEYLLHENEACSVTCKKILHLWTLNPHLINEYAPLFLNSINTHCYNEFIRKNISELEQSIHECKHLAKSHLENEYSRRIFEIIYFNTILKIFHKRAQYEEVKRLILHQAEKILSLSDQILPAPDALSVSTTICISYFVLEQWENAESLLFSIKEKNRRINREDVLFFTLMFHLLILFEKKEWYRLDNAIESAYHFLYARKKLRPFERKLMLFLKRLPTACARGTITEIIPPFLEELERMNKHHKLLYSLYFNYYGWLESKVEGLHYMDYVRRRVKAEEEGSNNE